MFKQLGPTELIIILVIVLLLFGGKKLPDAARGLGRSLRIFKAETKGMADDDAQAIEASGQSRPSTPADSGVESKDTREA